MILKRLLGEFFYKIEIIISTWKTEYINSLVNGEGSIGGDSIVVNPQNIYIGKGSFVNSGQIIAGKESKIVIGKNVMISYNVHIRTTKHIIDDINTDMKLQGMTEEDIIIGDNAWIGYGAQIMSGVSIGQGAIVGAGAVVTKDVMEFDVVGGIPAKVIRNRKNEISNSNN